MAEEKQKKWTPKRIAAIVALALLALLYLVTFVVALVSPAGAGSLFGVCLMATIAVPILAWIYLWLYGQITGKRTMADLNLMQDAPGKEQEPAEAEK